MPRARFGSTPGDTPTEAGAAAATWLRAGDVADVMAARLAAAARAAASRWAAVGAAWACALDGGAAASTATTAASASAKPGLNPFIAAPIPLPRRLVHAHWA